MHNKTLSGGVVHKLSADVQKKLEVDTKARTAWEDITSLARNEWLCWIESAKLVETRERRIKRMISELKEGMRRPCCWAGCMHR